MPNWEKLARAETHPLRVRILEAIEASPEPTCPTELVSVVGAYVSKVGYHTVELAKAGLIELHHTAPIRGTVAHYYRAASS